MPCKWLNFDFKLTLMVFVCDVSFSLSLISNIQSGRGSSGQGEADSTPCIKNQEEEGLLWKVRGQSVRSQVRFFAVRVRCVFWGVWGSRVCARPQGDVRLLRLQVSLLLQRGHGRPPGEQVPQGPLQVPVQSAVQAHHRLPAGAGASLNGLIDVLVFQFCFFFYHFAC